MTDRIVFMGTPEFAVPTLQALLAAPHVDVVGVVTQPDRPAGRGRRLHMPPVKALALAAGLPILQPAQRLDRTDALAQLIAWDPAYFVVIAYGQILRQNVLDIPRVMPINVHASLLPRWRGAAPIPYAIMAGDAQTGVTTMRMDAGMDTGPILLQDAIPILPDDTGQSLHDRLATLGTRLLIETLDGLRAGTITPQPQPDDETQITYAPMLAKDAGAIDWTQPAEAIDRHVRAFFPWPGTYTFWGERRVKVIEGRTLPHDLGAAPGEVVDLRGTQLDEFGVLAIGTGYGVYLPATLQLAGRTAQDVRAFLNGAPDFTGARLGSKS